MEASADGPSPFGPGNPERPSYAYLFLRFLRYGWLAWGGPVAQIGLMHREVVERDRWISEERFRKVLALYQALPGPEAHELAVYFGMVKRGRLGGFLTGLGFMLPGIVFVTTVAALYVQYSGTSDVAKILLYGVRPAVVALVAVMFLHLLRRAVPTTPLILLSIASGLFAYITPQVNFLVILVVAGFVGLGLEFVSNRSAPPLRATGILPFSLLATFPALSQAGLLALAAISLKVGLLTFGGAYTAIPFLHDGAVVEQKWLTDEQFLDALALSGLVPGPLIGVGTFVGYQAAALPGAVVATILMFAPAFLFTLLGHHFFERVMHEPRLHAFLLGVTAGVVGLIAASVVPLGRAAFIDVGTLLIGLAAAAVLFFARRFPIPLVILSSGAVGAVVFRALGKG